MTAVVAAGLVSGCGPVELQSHWQSSAINIDGINDEWNAGAVFVEDPGIVINIRNDAEYVYVCLMTSDRAVQRRVMTQGLIVWLDNDNDKNKDFGIRFPLGMMESGGTGEGAKPGGPGERRGPRGAGGQDEQQRFDEFFDEHIDSQSEFDLIGPAGMGLRRVQFGEVERIEVGVGRSRGALVYELKVPLHRKGGDYYAVNSNPGEFIGIGLESPEMDRSAVGGRGGMGGGMGRGGGMGGRRPGGGMGGPGGRGAPPGGGRTEMAESFNVWASVQLAAGE